MSNTRAKRKPKERCSTKYCRGIRNGKMRICSKCNMRKWRARNPMVAYYRMVRDHAVARQIKVEVTYEQFAPWAIAHGLFVDGAKVKGLQVDRKDATKPYAVWNMQVLTFEENQAKGNVERHTEHYRKNRWLRERPEIETVANPNEPF